MAAALASTLLLTACPHHTQDNADNGPHSPYAGLWIQASSIMGYQKNQAFCGQNRQVRSEMPEAIWVQDDGEVLRVSDGGYFTPGPTAYPPFDQYQQYQHQYQQNQYPFQQALPTPGMESRFVLDNSSLPSGTSPDQQKYLFIYPSSGTPTLYYVRKTDQEALAYFNAVSRCADGRFDGRDSHFDGRDDHSRDGRDSRDGRNDDHGDSRDRYSRDRYSEAPNMAPNGAPNVPPNGVPNQAPQGPLQPPQQQPLQPRYQPLPQLPQQVPQQPAAPRVRQPSPQQQQPPQSRQPQRNDDSQPPSAPEYPYYR
jgi:hypothetical protein